MDDFLDNTSTTGTIAVGGMVSGNIETTGDRDWFAATLQAGTSYIIRLGGSASGSGTLFDPYLDIFDSTGTTLLASDDDSGPGPDSRLVFTPSTSGTFFLSARAFFNFGTGTYTLTLAEQGPAGNVSNVTQFTEHATLAEAEAAASAFDLLRVNSTYAVTETVAVDVNFLTVELGPTTPAPTFNLADTVSFFTLAGSGAATVQAGTNGDFIQGNTGANTLLGGAGADYVYTTFGDLAGDVINGFGGNDTMYGGGGPDQIDGGEGDDFVTGAAGNDTLVGGLGNDILYGGLGDDTVTGGAGSDDLFGELGADSLAGDAGDDDLFGGEGNDTLDGGEGADRLFGDAGDDTLNGGAGVDFVFGGAGADTADGGADFDLFAFFNLGGFNNPAFGAYVNLADQTQNAFAAAGDLLSNFESIALTSFGDQFYGGANTVIVAGLGGDDILFGSSEADILVGGAGADYMDGGAGLDSAYYSDSLGGVGIDRLAPSRSFGDAAGDYFVSIEGYSLTAFGDSFQGADPVNFVYGLSGADQMFGSVNSNDWFFGGDGDDFLAGGTWDDRLEGGAGADFFAFASFATGGLDTIADFQSGQDKIQLTGPNFGGLAPGSTLQAGQTFIVGSVATGLAAVTAAATVLYDYTTGLLYFDADGTGAGASDAFAQLANLPGLAASDFTVVALA